jgi:hypothetical protein
VTPARAPAASTSRPHTDVNAVVGGYLRDLALAQSSRPKRFGYRPSVERSARSTLRTAAGSG